MRGGKRINSGRKPIHGVAVKSSYTAVYFDVRHNSWRGVIMINKKYYRTFAYKTEKEAAIALDRKLMRNGYKPINVFKATIKV